MENQVKAAQNDTTLLSDKRDVLVPQRQRGKKRSLDEKKRECDRYKVAGNLENLSLREEDSSSTIDTALPDADALENLILELPDGNTLPNELKAVFIPIVNNMKTFSAMLQQEIDTNKKSRLEVKELKEQVSYLNIQLENSKQWQTVVYDEVRKANSNIQQYALQLSQLPHQNNKDNVNNEFGSENVIKPTRKKKKKKKCSFITGSMAVPYGDSLVSKKLKERQIYKTTGDNDEEFHCKDYSEEQMELVPTNLSSVQDSSIVRTINEMKQQSKMNLTDTTDAKAEAELSVEETLRRTAESAMSENGLVYDESSCLYYDWNSKMYYDPSTKLYYDHENGIYYHYDVDKKGYLFHSQIELPKASEEKQTKGKGSSSELSDGEICSDESEEVELIDSCIRAIVVQSESLTVGSLFIITCKGGSVGRAPSNLISIPEEMVSKIHAHIIYDETDKTFYIQDRQTQNGTFINNERLADPKTFTEPVELTHRDYIKLGDTTFSFHVHLGHETCSECEPGNIKAIIKLNEERNLVKEDLGVQRKKELKSMRKKYGISPGYVPTGLIKSIPDRAGIRRKEVGIDVYGDSNIPVTSASVYKEIPEDNVGHKMLAKMGWKSGQGLGKTGTGITNPVTVDAREKNKGLGTGKKISLDLTGHSRKNDKWTKAKERYEKLENK